MYEDDLIEAKWIKDHRVYLKFEDGTNGILDFAKYSQFESSFAILKNPKEFAKLKLKNNTLFWGKISIAPEALYVWLQEELKTSQPKIANV
jgi:hypothetical protein